ncbi:MAG: DUF5723 family protein [Chitinophagales bacterium]
MKKIILICLVFASIGLHAQSFLGVHTSNYDPLKTGLFNPASPATSLMKWEVSLVGFEVHAAQNYLKLKGGIKEWASDFDKDVNVVENLNGEDKTGNVTFDIPTLGFVFNNAKVGAIYLSNRSRVIVDAQGIKEEFISSMYNDPNNIYNWANEISDSKLSLNAHAFSEISFGYSRYVLSKEKHALSAGATVKLLVPGFSGKVNGDVDITIDEAAETANFGTTDISAISSSELNAIDDDNYSKSFKIGGVGFDLGAVYEWKTGQGTTKIVGKNKNKVKIQPDYFLKAGFAVLDIGKIKYEHSVYSREFFGDGTTVALADITQSDSSFQDFDDVLNAVGSYNEFTGDFKTKLPTALSMFLDAKLTRGIYVNASAIINLGKFSDGTPKARTQSIYSITPRFELPMVGVQIPMAYNTINGFEMGTSFRFSQFVIGSSNIFSYLWSKETSSIDIQFAMAFGGVNKDKKKEVKQLIDDEEMLLQDNTEEPAKTKKSKKNK